MMMVKKMMVDDLREEQRRREAEEECFSCSGFSSSCINCSPGPTIKGGSIMNSRSEVSSSSSSISDERDSGADAAEDDVSSSGMVGWFSITYYDVILCAQHLYKN